MSHGADSWLFEHRARTAAHIAPTRQETQREVASERSDNPSPNLRRTRTTPRSLIAKDLCFVSVFDIHPIYGEYRYRIATWPVSRPAHFPLITTTRCNLLTRVIDPDSFHHQQISRCSKYCDQSRPPPDWTLPHPIARRLDPIDPQEVHCAFCGHPSQLPAH